MSDLIKLFNSKIQTEKLVGENNFFKTDKELTELNKLQQKYISNTDYSVPENFAIFGSAEEYYKNGFNYINSNYPYDQSTEKKLEWINSLSEFEYYLFKDQFPRATGFTTLSSSQYIKINSHVQQIDETAKNIYDNLYKYCSNTLLDFNNGFNFEGWFNFIDNSENFTLLSTNILFENIGNVEEKELFKIYRDSASSKFIISSSDNSYIFNTIIQDNEWHHYSFNINNDNLTLFIDGKINQIIENPSLNFITSSFVFVERGLMTKELFDSYTTYNFNKTHVFKIGGGCKTSIDDIRIWKGSRTVEQIGRNWFTNIDGNNFNSIDSSELLIYYKFNEGWDDEYKFLCLDYSGRQNDGEIINYSFDCRSTGSAFDLSNLVQDPENKDIIYKGLTYSSDVKEYYENLITSGKEYDLENTHMLYNKFPSWLLEQEEMKEIKHLKQIIQIIASYFDDLYNKISEITEYKKIKLEDNIDNIYPFYDKILTSTGFDVTDLFSNLDIIEKISSRNDTTLFDEDIQKVKNAIFKNIYNNISYIFKAKGTEKSLKTLIKSYGLNEDLIRINLYSDGALYKVKNKSKEKIIKKKTITLTGNNIIYLNSNDILEDDQLNYLTIETCVTFPKHLKPDTNKTSSLFGLQNNTLPGDTSWSTSNNLYHVVTENNINYGNRFLLLSSSYILASSSYIQDIYDDTPWNICIRKKPSLDTLTGSIAPVAYTLELYCINNNSYFNQEILLSSSYFHTDGYISYYIGAQKQNLTGSTVYEANNKFLYCNFWKDYLSNDNIISHNMDILNYGTDE